MGGRSNNKGGEMTKYTVWVGGVEVNDYYLSEDEAIVLAEEWEKDDYTDVQIEEVEVDDETPEQTNAWLLSGGF